MQWIHALHLWPISFAGSGHAKVQFFGLKGQEAWARGLRQGSLLIGVTHPNLAGFQQPLERIVSAPRGRETAYRSLHAEAEYQGPRVVPIANSPKTTSLKAGSQRRLWPFLRLLCVNCNGSHTARHVGAAGHAALSPKVREGLLASFSRSSARGDAQPAPQVQGHRLP